MATTAPALTPAATLSLRGPGAGVLARLAAHASTLREARA